MKIHFLGGLPRAGSTLLCNILAQNPKVYTTPTSPVCDILFKMKHMLNEITEFKTQSFEDGAEPMRRGMWSFIRGYYNPYLDQTIIDKNRGWISMIDVMENVLEEKVKIIVPIRDIRDVIASFERLYKKYPLNRMPQEINHYTEWQTLEGRINVWLNTNEPVGIALNRIRELFLSKQEGRCFFVRFEDLTKEPKRTTEMIYKFLEIEQFGHNFDNVVQVTHENDRINGIPHLHDISSKVQPLKYDWKDILPQSASDGILKQYSWFYNTFYNKLVP